MTSGAETVRRQAPSASSDVAEIGTASLEDFFENGSIGLHIVGPDGAILRANKAELELLGYAAEEYIGRRIADFHADEAVIADILDRLGRGEVLDKYPARLRAKDGSLRHVQISSSVCFDEQGRFRHTRCFTVDVTALRRLEERRDLLVAELNHRVMNTLSVVQSLARQSFNGHADAAAGQGSFLERLRALSAIHKLLGRNDWGFANLQCALEIALAPYPRERWSLEGPTIPLGPAVAIDLALVFNELSTNAAKHGAFAAEAGRVQVTWREADREGGTAELVWRETGCAVAGNPGRVGFGHRLLEQVVTRQLDGRLDLDFAQDGLDCRMTFVTRR